MTTSSADLLAFALEAERRLLGPDAAAWLDRLEAERERLHHLLDELTQADDADRALRLVGALAKFWWMRGHAADGLPRVERVLRLSGGDGEPRGLALVGAGSLAYALGDFRAARAHYEAAVPLLRHLDLAHALDRAGMAARQLLDLDAAQVLHTEALTIQRAAGTPAGVALCLNNLGVVAFFLGDLDAARTAHREALALRREVGDVRGEASSLNNLGQVERLAGESLAARDLLERGLSLRQQLGDTWGEAGSHVNLAAVAIALGDLALARTQLREAVARFRAVGDPLGECECLEVAAELAHATGNAADSAALLAAATAGRERLPAPRPPVLQRFLARLGERASEEATEALLGRYT